MIETLIDIIFKYYPGFLFGGGLVFLFMKYIATKPWVTRKIEDEKSDRKKEIGIISTRLENLTRETEKMVSATNKNSKELSALTAQISTYITLTSKRD